MARQVQLAIDSAHMAEQESGQLRELVRTNDIVLVSAIGALLDGANIHHLVLDQNMSIIEGSLGILPRRILVHEDDNRAARQLLALSPVMAQLAPASRAFLRRAVSYLAAEAGVRQFLDIGTGMPADGSTHSVAQYGSLIPSHDAANNAAAAAAP